MAHYRNVILIKNDQNELFEIFKRLPNWQYTEELEIARNNAFVLIHSEENIIIVFNRLMEGVYWSMNVLPYDTSNLEMDEICEPDVENIKKDILFRLCIDVRREYVNHEIICGIMPCSEDFNLTTL